MKSFLDETEDVSFFGSQYNSLWSLATASLAMHLMRDSFSYQPMYRTRCKELLLLVVWTEKHPPWVDETCQKWHSISTLKRINIEESPIAFSPIQELIQTVRRLLNKWIYIDLSLASLKRLPMLECIWHGLVMWSFVTSFIASRFIVRQVAASGRTDDKSRCSMTCAHVSGGMISWAFQLSCCLGSGWLLFLQNCEHEEVGLIRHPQIGGSWSRRLTANDFSHPFNAKQSTWLPNFQTELPSSGSRVLLVFTQKEEVVKSVVLYCQVLCSLHWLCCIQINIMPPLWSMSYVMNGWSHPKK